MATTLAAATTAPFALLARKLILARELVQDQARGILVGIVKDKKDVTELTT